MGRRFTGDVTIEVGGSGWAKGYAPRNHDAEGRVAKRVAKSPPDDPHMNRVYDWEDLRRFATWGTSQPANKLRIIANKIAKWYKIRQPVLKFVNREKPVWSGLTEYSIRTNAAGEIVGDQVAISLNRYWGGRNVRTLVHEMAHYILWERGHRELQPHGKEFLGLYLYLMDWWKVEPLDASVPSAVHHKLKFVPPNTFYPPEFLKHEHFRKSPRRTRRSRS
jgi:hypothetical protein